MMHRTTHRRHTSVALSLTALATCHAVASPIPLDGITVNITNDPDGILSGVRLNTLSITRGGLPETFLASELIGIDLLDATRPETPIIDPESTTSPPAFVLIGPAREPEGPTGAPLPSPQPGERETYLTDDDVATLFLNWPVIEVRFTAPVTNGPGADIVLIEGTSDLVIEGDPERDPPLPPTDDRTVTVTSNGGSLTIVPADYADLGINPNLGFFQAGGSGMNGMPVNFPPTNLAELEALPNFSSVGSLSTNRETLLHGVAFDLTDLGYTPGAVITDLELTFTSGNPDDPNYFEEFNPSAFVFDPSFIAALPASSAPLNPCDFNADGFVDAYDVADALLAVFLGSAAADVVPPTGIDTADVEALVGPIRDQLCD